MPETSGNSDQSAHTHLQVSPNLNGVARGAADLFVRLSQAKIASAGPGAPYTPLTVALSGGTTPRALNQLLTSPLYIDQVDWTKIEFFWGDERSVAPDDPLSNYRMARETLLAHVPVTESQIHPIPTELDDPNLVAVRYEEELRAAFHLSSGQIPRFDLIFLGMGPDGHTASLFPHTAALAVTDRLVVANFVPKLATYRITLSAPVINNAAVVAFLAAGPDKATALAAVLEGPSDPEEYPAQLIAPVDGDLYWMVDQAAAAQLTRQRPDGES